jgi:CheY-like chemotaxis protein
LNYNDAISRLREDPPPLQRRIRRHGRRMLLVVDDCVEQRELYEFLLARDFDLVSAGRGPEAISLALERQPDAIVLDVQMPEMNGIEVCRRLKRHKDTAAIPVVMLTGSPRDVRDEAAAAGAAAVLTKPCPIDTLIEYVVGSIINAEAIARTVERAI